MRKLKLLRIAILSLVAAAIIPISTISAETFIRAANNSVSAGAGGGDGSYNRAVACGDGKCYAHGGGTNNTSTGPSNALIEYDIATDTWSTLTPSSTRPLYRNATASVSNGYFVARNRGTGNSSTTETTYSYNITTDSWQSVTTSPPAWTGGFGMVGIAVGNTYYIFSPSGFDGSIDIRNLAAGWNSKVGPSGFPSGGACVAGDGMEYDSPVYDPINNTIVVFHGDCVGVYSVATDSWAYSSANVLPESNTPVSIAYYDANNGITFGYWDQPTDSIVRYTLDISDFSVTAISNLTDTDMDYGPFDDATVGPYTIPSGYLENDSGETQLLFGSARTNRTSPVGGTANRWFLVTGDPGGVNPTGPHTIYDWLDNFLTSMGLNSPLGKFAVGGGFSLFLMVFLLAIKVPPLIALFVGTLSGSALVAALLISPEAFLIGLGIGGLGLFVTIFTVFTSRTE